MEAKNLGGTFVDSLSPDMSKEDFLQRIREVATDEDRKAFGADYEDQLAQVVLYPAVFAPFPATFDGNAIAGIIDNVGSSDFEKNQDPSSDLIFADTMILRTANIIDRAIALGVIEPNENGRFFIRQETIDKLQPILNKFDGEE